jgi:hypothetical protein
LDIEYKTPLESWKESEVFKGVFGHKKETVSSCGEFRVLRYLCSKLIEGMTVFGFLCLLE